MALDRLTTLSALSLSLSLLLACVPSNNDAADAGKNSGAPQPTAVCQHVRTLAANDTKDEQVLDQIQRDCVQSLEGLSSLYETFATCVQDATTPAGVRECEAALAKPPSLLAGGASGASIEEVCEHVIGRLRAEIPQIDTNSVDPADVDQLRQRCITDASKKREQLGAEAFAKQVDCLMAAQDLKTMQACGSF
jgi:hypothetical protein